MNATEIQWIAIITSIVFSAVAFFQARKSIKVRETARNDSNLYSASELLIDKWDEIQHFHDLYDKATPYSEWTIEDKKKAASLCLAFHHIGLLVDKGAISDDICELYFYSIPRMSFALEEYLKAVRSPEHPDFRHEDYWFRFQDLVDRTQALNKAKKRIVNLRQIDNSNISNSN